MDYKEFRKIDIISYLRDNGYKTDYQNLTQGKLLIVCPVCRKKNHFLINKDGNCYSFNGCFGGDIIDLHARLEGIPKIDSINHLKSKYLGLMDNRSTNQQKRLTINIENLDIEKKILEYYDREICKFIIDLSQDYSKKTDKTKSIIDKIILKILSFKSSIDKYDYIQYIKIIKYENSKKIN